MCRYVAMTIAAVWIWAVLPESAQAVPFCEDAIVDYDVGERYPPDPDVQAGCELSGVLHPATVTIVAGGLVNKANALITGSAIILDGGTIYGQLGIVVNDGCSVVVSSGKFTSLYGGSSDQATCTTTVNGGTGFGVYVFGGTATFTQNAGDLTGYLTGGVDSPIEYPDAPTLNLFGGTLKGIPNEHQLNAVTAYDSTTINLTGTAIDGGIDLYHSTRLYMDGGIVNGDVFLKSGLARATQTAGVIKGSLRVEPGDAISSAEIQGNATVSQLGSLTLSQATVSGGVTAFNPVRLKIDGGSIGENVQLTETNEFQIAGATIGGDVRIDASKFGHDDASFSNTQIAGSFAQTGKAGTSFSNGSVGGTVTVNGGELHMNDAIVQQEMFVTGSSSRVYLNADMKDLLWVGDHASVILQGGTCPGVSVNQGDLILEAGGIEGDVISFRGAVTLKQGHIDGSIASSSFGLVTVTNGHVGHDVTLASISGCHVDGGTIGGFISLDDAANLTMTGGHALSIIENGPFTSIIMTGGSLSQNMEINAGIGVLSLPDARISGGQIGGDFNIRGKALAVINNGEIKHDLNAYDSSYVQFNGGVVDGVIVLHGAARMVLAGGTALGGVIHGNSPVAGPQSLEPTLFAYDNSSIIVNGINLNATLLDPNNGGMFSTYELSGFSANGAPLNGLVIAVQNGTGASYQLTPICQMLRNPGFEDVPGNAQGEGLMPSDWVSIPAAEPGADTYSDDGAYGLLADDACECGYPVEGHRWMACRSDNAEDIAQVLRVPLTPGHTYRLVAQLYQSGWPQYDHPGTFRVTFRDSGDSSVFEAGQFRPTEHPYNWDFRSIVFTAPANAEQLNVLRLSPTERGEGPVYLGIDDVNLAEIAVCPCAYGPVDLNCDSRVDQEEVSRFQECFSGPNIGPLAPGCEQADFDHDGDVDQVDFAAVQRCYNGVNYISNPNCAD